MNSSTFSIAFGLTACLVLGACADDGGKTDEAAGSETGDGDGDPTTTGDGDGDPTTGDGDGDPTTGDGDGDGDPTTGDGDGDPTTGDGDGDGDPTTGDGDGDPTTGDGDGDPDNCATTYETCGELMAAFAAETAVVRSCSSDAECGTPLVGTSCGCTKNWVARLDADTTCFYSLINQAGALDCDLGLFSDCSCPEADGFVCAGGTCAWNYL